MASIDFETLEVLRGATVAEHNVVLNCGDLPKPLYERVNEVLVRLGGKWRGGRTRAHVFPFDPKETLAGVVQSGEMPPKNTFAFFPTPPAVIRRMLDLADRIDCQPKRILEPSAGGGAIAAAARAKWPLADLVCVECDPFHAGLLKSKGFLVRHADFLSVVIAQPFDLVLMNPPFSVEGDRVAYVTHTRRAFEMLRPGGLLVGVAASSFTFATSLRALMAFRDFVGEHGGWTDLPAESFRESGTSVHTCLIYLQKP